MVSFLQLDDACPHEAQSVAGVLGDQFSSESLQCIFHVLKLFVTYLYPFFEFSNLNYYQVVLVVLEIGLSVFL